MKIKILGTGCPNCQKLEANVKKALEELKVEAVVEKITKMEEITEYGVMSLPGIVVDEKVLASGRVLSVSEVRDMLNDINKAKCAGDEGCHSCHCC
jgi:small redox-active disulfide protein 2